MVAEGEHRSLITHYISTDGSTTTSEGELRPGRAHRRLQADHDRTDDSSSGSGSLSGFGSSFADSSWSESYGGTDIALAHLQQKGDSSSGDSSSSWLHGQHQQPGRPSNRTDGQLDWTGSFADEPYGPPPSGPGGPSGDGEPPEPEPPTVAPPVPAPPPPVVVNVTAVVLTAGSESHTAAVNAIAEAFALAASTEAASGAAAAAAEQPPVKVASSATFAVHPDQLPEGSQARTDFSTSFRTSMADSFGGGNLIAPDKVIINAIGLSTRRRLQTGTTTVDFHIETPLAVADHAASMMLTLASSNETLSVSIRNETLGASSMAAPVVTRAPDVNCTGAWSNCTSTCSAKMYLVSITASGAGTACSADHGTTAACAFGDGNCQAPAPLSTPAGTGSSRSSSWSGSSSWSESYDGTGVAPLLTPAGAVRGKLLLPVAIEEIAEGTPEREAFETSFRSDVAGHLGVDASRIVINSIQAGSVVVDFHVLPDEYGTPISASVVSSALIVGVTVAGHTLAEGVADVVTAPVDPRASAVLPVEVIITGASPPDCAAPMGLPPTIAVFVVAASITPPAAAAADNDAAGISVHKNLSAMNGPHQVEITGPPPSCPACRCQQLY